MRVIKGTYGGRRAAIGYLRLCRVMQKRMRAARLSAQRERLCSAIAVASEEIGIMRKNAEESVGEEHGEIFSVYLKILSSESLLDSLCKRIGSGGTSEEAISALLTDGSVPLDGEFSLCHVKEALDILMGVLEDIPCPPSGGTAVPDACGGICVSDGESLIHILNRADSDDIVGAICLTAEELTAAVSRGIPAMLIEETELPDDECEGVTAILDCRRKRLILDPDLPELERYSELGREDEKRREELEKLTDLTSVTSSGKRIFLCGELDRGTSLNEFSRSGGDPRAIYITDGLEHVSDHPSLEESQYEVFKKLAASDMSMTVRLYGLPPSDGSHFLFQRTMGLRGAGLFALFRQVYKAQLRALLRASGEGGLSLLLPDVCAESELWQFRALFREAKNELKSAGLPFCEPEGYSVELSTPSALLTADRLAEGTSSVIIDLDRLVSLTSAAEHFDPISEDQLRLGIAPALQLCAHAIDSLSTGNRRFGVRGDLVSEPDLTHSLIECGFDTLFLRPAPLLAVKERVLSFDG